MPKRTPSLRLHKPSGRAVVTLDGKDHYLGKFDSAESRENYHRLLAEWMSSRKFTAPSGAKANPPALTVVEMLVAFWRYAEGHYRQADGQPTGELGNLKAALRPLRELYGKSTAADFGPLALRAVRTRMVESGLARTSINAQVNRIRRAFRWAASVELIPVGVVQALETLAGLQQGRTTARETEPIGPVPLEVVEKTLPYLPRQVAALVRFQLLTGCRPGEACDVRGCDLKPGSPNWTYEPGRHKSAWRGKRRVIPIGPKARALLAEFERGKPEDFLFDPREAVAAQHAERTRNRKSKPTPSERSKRKAKPGENHSRRYDRTSYRRAICRACDRAFPHPTISAIGPSKRTAEQRAELDAWQKEHHWHPNQLRHTVGTNVRARFGLEASQTVLGHSKANTTQIYAERDLAKAHEVISEIG